MARMKYDTFVDVRKVLGLALRDLRSEKIDENRARAIAYVCQVLSRVIETSDVEQRLAALEEKLKNEINR